VTLASLKPEDVAGVRYRYRPAPPEIRTRKPSSPSPPKGAAATPAQANAESRATSKPEKNKMRFLTGSIDEKSGRIDASPPAAGVADTQNNRTNARACMPGELARMKTFGRKQPPPTCRPFAVHARRNLSTALRPRRHLVTGLVCNRRLRMWAVFRLLWPVDKWRVGEGVCPRTAWRTCGIGTRGESGGPL
jgi:hypothetical protein